jgi:hypothetical protein
MTSTATETQKQDTQAAKQQRALVPVAINGLGMLQPANLAEAVEVAKLIAHSGIVPKIYEGNPGAVLVAIQMGSEIGLSPMAALQGIAVINGRPSLYGDAMLAVVCGHRECEDVVEDIDTKTMTATCTVKRHEKSPVTRTFSIEDAKTAGLWGKQGPWTQYPKRMLQMRARAFALRDAFPDALRGVHSADESRDMVIDATPEWVEPGSREPKEGTFSVRKPKGNGGNGKAIAAGIENGVVIETPAAETPHDPITGEVKQEPKQEDKPAAVNDPKKAEQPKVQGKLGW